MPANKHPYFYSLFAVCLITLLFAAPIAAQTAYIRINQAGYLPTDSKIAIAFSAKPLSGKFSVQDATSKRTIFTGKLRTIDAQAWGGKFPYYYALDFTRVKRSGNFILSLENTGETSAQFPVGEYPAYQENLLFFMRQQRCGYNPYLGVACHQHDGKTFFGPMPDGTVIDVTGGWHDAGDQLKYLITASNATARMMLAYEMQKDKFADTVDALGRNGANGFPDVLDEAKWGLEWIFKLHPKPDQLFHQVADDRDHRGFKLPDHDNADYGWGPNSYRPVYFADGKPQGLSKWKSNSTGVANIAGRSAAAMAMGYRIWKNDLKDTQYAEKCLKAALELYAMGQKQEGFQQGNSYGAPYRYNEDTWADDMEWAAAELYKATKKPEFLTDAKRYAKIIGATSFMQYESSDMGEQMSRHYELYPFTNIGHFALYPLVDRKTKAELAGYYRDGIERVIARGKTNAYGVGVPFLWCSNNLVVAFVTQVMLYEKMTGDMLFHREMLAHRDWLLGRNPWGTSMFSGIPASGVSPHDVHLPLVQILKRQIPGGLVDGPIDAKTYSGLVGLRLTHDDAFALFQPAGIVYHDDVGDYSTNEPTMDGTADAILMMAMFSGKHSPSKSTASGFTYDHGAITRGDKTAKKIAIVFTGDEFGEGAQDIAKTLEKEKVKASFFLTGRFYRNPKFAAVIKRLKRDGNYLGPHSNDHPLYADWTDRNKTLVTKEQFDTDLTKNYEAMEQFGIRRSDAKFFLPPYEWHNQTIADWTTASGLQLVNFTPGTGSNADYTTPSMKNYVTSDEILQRIKNYEAKDQKGLNGFILLMHIGAGPERTDKFYSHLPELIAWLRSKNYQPIRIDQLLKH